MQKKKKKKKTSKLSKLKLLKLLCITMDCGTYHYYKAQFTAEICASYRSNAKQSSVLLLNGRYIIESQFSRPGLSSRLN